MKVLACVGVALLVAGCDKPNSGADDWNGLPTDNTALVDEASAYFGRMGQDLDCGSAWFGVFVSDRQLTVLRVIVREGASITDYSLIVSAEPSMQTAPAAEPLRALPRHSLSPVDNPAHPQLKTAEFDQFDVPPSFQGTLVCRFNYTLRKGKYLSKEHATFNVTWPQ